MTNLQINLTNIEKQLLNRSYYPQLDLLTRNAFAIYKHIQKLYNFSYDLKITNNWGYFNETTGHFDPGSMLGELEVGNVEMGLTFVRMYPRRLSVVFFVHPSGSYRSCFIFKHPSSLASYSAFAKPFTIPLWFCIFTTFTLAGISLRFMKRYEIKDLPKNESNLSNSLLIILGILCQQGIYSDSFRNPTRILTLVFQLMSFMVYSFYGAEIVGFLLTDSPRTINTLDKLIDSPFKLYSENLPYYHNHFTERINDKVTRAYQKAIKGPTRDQDKYISLEEGVEEIRKGRMALYAQDINMYAEIDRTFTNSEKCSIHEIEMLKLLTATVIRKKSPFRELIYRGVLRLAESGFKYRENKIWNSRKPECLGNGERSSGVSLEATLIAQVIFGIGITIAVILFSIEKQHYFLEKLNSKQKNNISQLHFDYNN
ncbi:hypothetical protein O3M35_003431 [Rhynocoris fuscipes]|uniref:Ionotropic glutamate receptor C-terminal domain-containing protein n=1 Tax=Rhynocoris fuscipes TaxID=488301 RepID=A0AAW1CIV5_9HEMI